MIYNNEANYKNQIIDEIASVIANEYINGNTQNLSEFDIYNKWSALYNKPFDNNVVFVLETIKDLFKMPVEILIQIEEKRLEDLYEK